MPQQLQMRERAANDAAPPWCARIHCICSIGGWHHACGGGLLHGGLDDSLRLVVQLETWPYVDFGVMLPFAFPISGDTLSSQLTND